MKFVCDRCGKKYATAGDPAPGKVYKLKCKACGHLIVVKGQSGTTTGLPVTSAAELASATSVQEVAHTPIPATVPAIELHVDHESDPRAPLPTPSPGSHPTVTVSLAEPHLEPIGDDAIEPLPAPGEPRSPPGGPLAALPPEVALAVDGAAASALPPTTLAGLDGLDELPEAPPALLDPALTPPPPERDELADFAAAAAEVMASPVAAGGGRVAGEAYRDLFEETGRHQLGSDAFAQAARASLPDGWSGAAPPAVAPPPVEPAPATIAAPARPAPPKPGLGRAPVAIIAVGVLALVAIAANSLLGGGAPPPQVALAAKAEPPSPPAAPAAPEPGPPTPEPAAAVSPPEPEPAAAEVAPKPPPRAEPKARPAERKAERRAEPRLAERVVEKKAEPPRPPPEPRTETREVDLPDGAAALTQEVVNRVVGANRKAFSTCIGNAASSGVALDGRQVALRITVNTNGTVTYPTLDDQSLNATEMGQCLKSAARLMIFPKFKGDPFHYEVPLILSGN